MTRDAPGSPAKRIEEMHRQLCRCTRALNDMITFRKLSPAEVSRVALMVKAVSEEMGDLEKFVLELKRQHGAKKAETENEVGGNSDDGVHRDTVSDGAGHSVAGGAETLSDAGMPENGKDSGRPRARKKRERT